MEDSLAVSVDIAPGTPQVASARRRWFELALVLMIAFGGALINAIYILKTGSPSSMMSGARWTYGIVQESSSLLLLWYVLSRRGIGFKEIGLRWSWRDLGVGLLVVGCSVAAYVFGWTLIQLVHYSAYGSWAIATSGRAFFAHPSIVFIPFSLLNPFFEELIVRAYLMTEVFELTGSRGLAVAMSVVVQFSYHLYYGWTGAISLSFLFLVFALYYIRWRRAAPVIVAHGVFDLYALVRLW